MSPQPDALREAARVTGLALADVSRRLAGPQPRVLLSDPDADRVDRVANECARLGFVVLTCDPAAAPGDDERIVARGIEWPDDRPLKVFDSHGTSHELPPTAVSLVQRGTRTSRTTETVTESKRQLALGKALLTGGLAISKKVERTSIRTTDHSERFVLLHRNDGAPDVILYERRLDYRFLAAQMESAATRNFDLLAARLATILPGVAWDDRVSHPGFITGLPPTASDATDLALFLVHLAHLRGGLKRE